MSSESEPQPQPTPPFVLALQAFMRGLLRLVLIVALIGLIAAAFYYALPLAYRELVLPVRETSARLDALSQQITSDRTAMNEQLTAVQARLNQLETSSAAADGRAADLQSGYDSLRKDLADLQIALDRLDQLEYALKALDTRQAQSAGQLATLEEGFRAPGGKLDSLRVEVETLKAMNLLTRAEVNLAQNNFGLARDDVMAARNVLLVMRDTLPAEEQNNVSGWIVRLDLAMANLPAFPLVAANDLEAAYQMLAMGVLPPEPTPGPVTITPTPTPWETPTAYLTPTEYIPMDATTTPFATATPSPYPTVTPSTTPIP
jgi:hypothetical protein